MAEIRGPNGKAVLIAALSASPTLLPAAAANFGDMPGRGTNVRDRAARARYGVLAGG